MADQKRRDRKMITGISWVGLFAEDVKKLCDFYTDIVGLTLQSYRTDCAILTTTNGDCLEIWDMGVASRERKTTEQQSTMIGFSVANLATDARRLLNQGVRPDQDVSDLDNSGWVHFLDPEGNRFELKQA